MAFFIYTAVFLRELMVLSFAIELLIVWHQRRKMYFHFAIIGSKTSL